MTPLDLANAEIARLQAKVEALETDVRFYKRQAEVERADEDSMRLAAALGVSPQAAWLVSMLDSAGARGLTHPFIMQNMPGRTHDGGSRSQKIIDVAVCRARRRLGRDAILTIWGRGFALSAKGKELLQRVRDGHLEDLPPERPTRSFYEKRKLSPEAVRVMRNATEPDCVKALAYAYGCSVGLVYGVRSRELYADVA